MPGLNGRSDRTQPPPYLPDRLKHAVACHIGSAGQRSYEYRIASEQCPVRRMQLPVERDAAYALARRNWTVRVGPRWQASPAVLQFHGDANTLGLEPEEELTRVPGGIAGLW